MKTRIILSFFVSFITLSTAIAADGNIKELERRLVNAIDTARINILNELSGIYASSDLDHADSLARQATILLASIDFPEGRIKNYNHLAYISSALGKHDLGLEYSDKAIKTSIQLSNDNLLAESYDNLFMIHFRQGNNAAAQPAADKMYEIAAATESVRLLAKSYDNLGIMKGIKGQHAEAIEYFMKSLESYEALGDNAKISIAMMHIGHTFELAGNYNEALVYLKKSLEINKKAGNRYNEGWALVNIGVALSRLNQIDSALVYYEKALLIAEEINNHRLILTCLDNIGGKYSVKKDFEKANYYLQRAYNLSNESGINSRTVYITGNLAENFLYMGQFDSAQAYAEKQLELALSSEIISEQKVAYYILAQIYDSLGEHKSAQRSLQEYIAVNDTIFSRQKSQQIETLRESFEAEKKEQELIGLKRSYEASKFKNRTYAAAALTLLLLAGLLFYMQSLKAKRNRVLLEKKKELDRMKSRFFANISHEFRTPLTLILGPLDDLITKVDVPAISKQLQVMQRNAGRLLDLVNQLLDLSKIESGSLKLNITNSDIVSVVKGVTMSFHSLAEQQQIDLALDILPEKLEINYDRAKLETVLTNLLANAFKFTAEKGTIAVNSRVINKQSGRGHREFLEIIVSDNGSGIPPEDIKQIFNRFYQSENNQLLQQEGSGIGLALTKELVELHEGKISAKSNIGEGTQIIVEIPTDLPPVSSPKEKEQAAIVVTTRELPEDLKAFNDISERTNNQEPVILVIEDHQDVRHYILETLKDRYKLETSINGEDGIAKAFEITPDLIICDVMMPKKDGHEVCTMLKKDARTSHIPIVLLTAKSSSDDKIEGLSTKADDYITKPFVPRELLVRIENLIESRSLLRKKYQKEGILKPKDIAVNSVDENFLNRLIELVDLNMSNEKFGVEQLSIEIGMSRSQLHRKLTALLGQGPNQFIRTFRLQRAHNLLKQNSATTAEIAYEVGFGSPSYFTKCFHEQFGYTPSEIHQQPVDTTAK